MFNNLLINNSLLYELRAEKAMALLLPQEVDEELQMLTVQIFLKMLQIRVLEAKTNYQTLLENKELH